MAYRADENSGDIIIDGFENGIASSPYNGIANMQNLNKDYYPGVAYVNYKRQAATVSFSGNTLWFAGAHSTDVSNNEGWTFTASSSSMKNPVQKATSPLGLNYILDDSGQIFKQSAVNSSTFNILEGGIGRVKDGSGGLAYWNNYLVVFGQGVIEFCGDGSGDAGITSSNWNVNNFTSGEARNSTTFTTDYVTNNDLSLDTVLAEMPKFQVGDPVTFTTTGTLPTGLSLNTTYYIITLVSQTDIQVSATQGGSSVTLTGNGTGTHTITDNSNPLPIGNCTSFTATISGTVVGNTTLTIVSYTNPKGQVVEDYWQEATGIYNVVMADNTKMPATFTNGSGTVTLLSPIVYISPGVWSIELLNTTVTDYRPYVSKVDGSLLFCNGQFVGRVAETSSPNVVFNPALTSTYNVSFGVTAIPEQFTDTVVEVMDLKSELVVAGKKDVYTWDYLSAQTSSPTLIGEQIFRIVNVLNNIYILAGEKGNIYVTNGYSAQLCYKIPDFIAGVIDPVWSWGGVMVHRSKLFFQLLVKNTSGTNLLAGVFSLIVSPSMIEPVVQGLVMEAQNSYGVTPASGALKNGVLMDNSPSSTGYDSYYSAWSNGATTGGIDYNDTTLWQNFEPTIETDIIPIGTILDKMTMGNIEFKLDRPMTTGDQIRMYWRPSLTDTYVLMGTTSTTQLSDYYPSNISQSQWAQFKVQFKCASSSSSFIPLREVRLHKN